MKEKSIENTTIALKKETRNFLASRGTKDQTFDAIISELLNKSGEKHDS